MHFFAGYPDFARWAKAHVELPEVVGTIKDFALADRSLAREWNMPSAAAAARWRRDERYTWHHHQDAKTLLLVPMELHANVPHAGGASLARKGAADDEFEPDWRAMQSVQLDGANALTPLNAGKRDGGLGRGRSAPDFVLDAPGEKEWFDSP